MSSTQLAELQKDLETQLSNFKALDKDYQKLIGARQRFDCQLTENEMVKVELDLLDKDAIVYKAVGPTLIKMDVVEARENVKKRIEFITQEVKRSETLITDFEKKQLKTRDTIQYLQGKYEGLRASKDGIAA